MRFFFRDIVVVFSISFFISCQNSDISNELVSVPLIFHDEMEDGHIDGNAYITVMIGNDSLQLFLDTGNPSASIDLTTKTLERINVRFTGETKKSWDYKGREYSSRKYILPNIKIGELEVPNIYGAEHKISSSSDGTFSFGFLDDFNILINYPNRNIRLYKLGYLPTYLSKNTWHIVDAFNQGGFRMPLRLVGFHSDISFTIDNAAIALDDKQKPFGLIRANSVFGEYLKDNNLIIPKEDDPSISGLFSSDNLTLNGTIIPKMDFMVVDYKYPESDGLMGYNFFIKYPMFIDFSSKKIYVKLE